MSKKSARSIASLSSALLKDPSENFEPTLDTLNIKIRSLRLADEDAKQFAIKVTYFDQLIVSGIIKSIGAKDKEQTNILAEGTMSYDPSDYEKMCLFADCPLVAIIQPLKILETANSQQSWPISQSVSHSRSDSTKSSNVLKATEISCCNVDILSIFLGDEENAKICVAKRMEPMIKPSVLQCKSWDCLPLLTMELLLTRHKDNAVHHKHLKEANWMQLTLIASYNMFVQSEENLGYTAISKTPLYCEFNTGLARFNEGTKAPKKFNPTDFYPKWESQSVGENSFAKGDTKFTCKLEDIRKEDKIDLHRYMRKMPQDNTIVWTSFHRSLLIKKSSEDWFAKHIQQYKWPLEIHIQVQDGVYSYMAFLNLFQLLYPGEKTVLLAVPLLWLNEPTMMQECNCSLLNVDENKAVSSSGTMQRPDRSVDIGLTGYDKAARRGNNLTKFLLNATTVLPFEGFWGRQYSLRCMCNISHLYAQVWKIFRTKTESTVSTEITVPILNDTGADENPAFVVVEIKLGRPLYKVVIPTRIMKTEIDEMLKASESIGPFKRRCVGRIAFAKKWQSSVQLATTALRRVPYFGTTEFSVFVRQLSETKTRVELSTTCWQDGALFVNNNFLVQQYLHSEEIFEEMVMMTHACLVRLACDHLLENNQQQRNTDLILKAARQAKQMRDTQHATDLYLQILVNSPRDANIWRELSTCLKDIDRDWARVSLYNSVMLNPRHPLTLLSTCGMVFEENPVDAEQFFVALLYFYPFWIMGWIIASVYYHERQQFLIYDKIIKIVQKSQQEGQTDEIPYARGWERELGDWWDSAQLLPGMSPFYDAADVLLRLRCLALAELCLARALSQMGESAVYYLMVALCCRLRGEYKDALCHVQVGIKKYGDVIYLRSLEAECHHILGNISDAMASYEKCSTSRWPHTVLMMLPIYTDPVQRRAVLWDLARRYPCAYTWMALAEICITNPVKRDDDDKNEKQSTSSNAGAIASAVQALKCDRLVGRAWKLLANNVKPSARRNYCLKMASLCGFMTDKDRLETNADSRQSSCYRLGIAITECRCRACEHLRL